MLHLPPPSSACVAGRARERRIPVYYCNPQTFHLRREFANRGRITAANFLTGYAAKRILHLFEGISTFMKTDCMERGGGCRIPPLPDLVLVAPLFSRIPPPPAECSSSSSSTALAPVEHCKWIDSGQQQQQPRLSSPPPPPPPQLARPPGDLEDLGSTKGIETSPPLSSHYIHLFSFRYTTLLRTNRPLGIEEVVFFHF